MTLHGRDGNINADTHIQNSNFVHAVLPVNSHRPLLPSGVSVDAEGTRNEAANSAEPSGSVIDPEGCQPTHHGRDINADLHSQNINCVRAVLPV